MDVTCLKDSLSSEKHAYNLKSYLAICHGVKILREDKNKLTGEKNLLRRTQKQHLAQKVPELKTIGSWESTAGKNHIHLPGTFFPYVCTYRHHWRYSIRVGRALLWQLRQILLVSCTSKTGQLPQTHPHAKVSDSFQVWFLPRPSHSST